jgi:protein-disulfide isomerase
MTTSRSVWTKWLDVVASVAMIAGGVTLVWVNFFRGPAVPAPRVIDIPDAPVTLAGAFTSGSAQAPIAVIEFSDFQCPFCARFAEESYPILKKEYVETGRVLWAFRHLPLESIHPLAVGAARAANCAGQQGKFWEAHDELFKNRTQISDVYLQSSLPSIGLDQASYDTCRQAPEVAAQVQADTELAEQLGLASTPTFAVGIVEGQSVKVTSFVAGNKPIAEMRQALDRALAAKER